MADSSEEIDGLVLDLGSIRWRCGFAGDGSPRYYNESVLGRSRLSHKSNESATSPPIRKTEDTYIGDEAVRRRESLSLSFPIQRGIVTDWDDMQTLLDHMLFRGLNLSEDSLSARSVLYTEAVLNPKYCREKMAELLVERYNVPAILACASPILTLYASGRTTGLAMDWGHGVTSVIPIYEGHIIPNGKRRVDFGGADLTAYLADLLSAKGHHFHTTAGLETVRIMKEELVYVASSEGETPSCYAPENKDFTLPDGNKITFGEELAQCGELLFNPGLLGAEYMHIPGMQTVAHESIMSCPRDCRKELWRNIVVSGAGSMHYGVAKRMQAELTRLRDQSASASHQQSASGEVKSIFPPERRKSVWIGGSVLASMSTFQDQWVTKVEYQEYGPTAIHRTAY
eukprot:scpid75680/ scgid3674/ Actin